ncbi:hypothetical protein Tco_0897352, partial [Tanacetum coccineum]
MLQGIDREDLEALWRTVKAKYGDTRPEDEFEKVLYGDLRVMFEPDIKSDLWRMLQGYMMMNIKFRGGLLGLKRLHGFLEVTAAQVHNGNYAKWIIPGHAGIVQTAKLCIIFDTREGEDESVMSTQYYIRNVIEDVGEDDDFMCASWLSVVEYVNVDGVTGCSRDVKKFLKNGKFEKVVAILKSCTLNALGDLTVTLKDLSGIISNTIHYKLLTEERFAKAITIGASLILHNVFVFSPKQSTHHYLFITKKNMVKVFHKDGGSS